MIGAGRANRESLDGTTIESLDLPNDDSMSFARARAGRLITGVDATTKSEVNTLISRAIRDGLTRDETARLIAAQFTDFAKYRSALIATMELGTAYEEGKWAQFDRYRQRFNEQGWKRSQSQGDDSVRPLHLDNEEQGWIPADQEFKGTKTQRAPHGFNCRCTTLYRLMKPEGVVEQLTTDDLLLAPFGKPNLKSFADRVEVEGLGKEEIASIDFAMKRFYDAHPKLPKLKAIADRAPQEILDIASDAQKVTMNEAEAFNMILWREGRHEGIVFNRGIIDAGAEKYSTLDDLKFRLLKKEISPAQFDDFTIRAPKVYGVATEYTGAEQVEVTAYHEMAHFIEFTLRTSRDLTAVNLVRDLDRIVPRWRVVNDYEANALITSQFTQYGLQNDREAFAEMYTAYYLRRLELINDTEVIEWLREVKNYLQ